MSEEMKQYVVCVHDDFPPHPESVRRICDMCFQPVWCMPFNLTRIPLCLDCVKKIPNPVFFMNGENALAAIEEIKRRKEKGHDST